MPAINLVPEELKPKRAIIELANYLKRIVIIGFVAFFVTVVVSVGGFLIVRNQVLGSIKRQNELKISIEALEETEQKLVLVQDRLAKADKIFGMDSLDVETSVLENILLNIPQGVNFKKADLKSGVTEITLIADTSSSLAEFLASILATGAYRRIEMTGFSYTPDTRYAFGLVLVK